MLNRRPYDHERHFLDRAANIALRSHLFEAGFERGEILLADGREHLGIGAVEEDRLTVGLPFRPALEPVLRRPGQLLARVKSIVVAAALAWSRPRDILR